MGNVETYKRTHRPKPLKEDAEVKGKPHQQIYIPKHPEKVVGGEIITRSSWETAFARWCDDNPSVVEWGSEPCSIQYRNPGGVNFDACRESGANPLDPLNWPVHEYYPDFYIALENNKEDDVEVQKMLIEIKPHYQTERPVPPPPGAKLQEQKDSTKQLKHIFKISKNGKRLLNGLNFTI